MTEWLLALNDHLTPLLPLVGGAVGGALICYLLTTTLTTCSIPGVLIPMSLTSGMLLGPWLAVLVVALGALTGSLFLFELTRRFGTARLRYRFGARVDRFAERLARAGPMTVIALRMIGAPGPLITAGAALTRMPRPVFALATLAGLLPSVVLAAVGAGTLAG